MKQHFCPVENTLLSFKNQCNWCGEKEDGMTQDEIIEMALVVGTIEDGDIFVFTHNELETFAKLVAQTEREACAEICDSFYLSWIDVQGRYEFMGEGASECAGAIRARGEA
jgi:hypothetical protein